MQSIHSIDSNEERNWNFVSSYEFQLICVRLRISKFVFNCEYAREDITHDRNCSDSSCSNSKDQTREKCRQKSDIQTIYVCVFDLASANLDNISIKRVYCVTNAAHSPGMLNSSIPSRYEANMSVAWVNIGFDNCSSIPQFEIDFNRNPQHQLNSLRPSDACMPTSSHYLKQCCNIVNFTLGNKLQWNLNQFFTFHPRKCILFFCQVIGDHFVSASVC